MTVKNLRELLEGVDDSAIVFIGDAEVGFESPDLEMSGISEFGPACDEQGNEIPEFDELTNQKVFILTTGNGLQETDE